MKIQTNLKLNKLCNKVSKHNLSGVFIFLFFSLNLSAYQISVSIENCPNIYLYLGKHKGPDFIIVDSIASTNGKAIFKGEQRLEKGVYFIVIPPQSRFDFIIDDNQNFEISSNLNNLIANLKITGDPQYQHFADLQKDIAKINLDRTRLNLELEFYNAFMPDTVKTIKAQLNALNLDQTLLYEKYLLKNEKSTFLYKLLNILNPFNLPDNIEPRCRAHRRRRPGRWSC